MGSDRKSEEKKKSRKRSPSSSSEDEGRGKRQRTGEDEDKKSRRSDKKDKSKDKKKSHKHSKHRSDKEKKTKDKHKSKHHKGDRLSYFFLQKIDFQELSNDDYFLKNNEFSTWLKEEKDVFFSDLSSESARQLFADFVKVWNKQKLESKYYEGIASGPRCAHAWKIKG